MHSRGREKFSFRQDGPASSRPKLGYAKTTFRLVVVATQVALPGAGFPEGLPQSRKDWLNRAGASELKERRKRKAEIGPGESQLNGAEAERKKIERSAAPPERARMRPGGAPQSARCAETAFSANCRSSSPEHRSESQA